MNQLKLKGIFFLCAIVVFCGCKVKKKDFDPNNVEWKNITPAWGVPIINSTMRITDAADQNKSNILIQYDPNDDDFISFVYLDTVYSPNGNDVLKTFGNNFGFGLYNTLEDIAAGIPLLPAGQKVSFSFPDAIIPFEIDSVKRLYELKLKGGVLKISGISEIKHHLSLTLTFPQMLSESGQPLVQTISLDHVANSPRTEFTLPDIELDGYTIKADVPNQLKYSLSGVVQTLNNDHPPATNAATSEDSLNIKLSFENLGYKHIIGEFNPLKFSAIPNGETKMDVFHNIVGDPVIYFNRPQVKFTFKNSFGVIPSVDVNSATMYYAYDTTKFGQLTSLPNSPSGTLKIPGTSSLNAPTISQINTSVDTVFLFDSTNSTLRELLIGAPYKFKYDIPTIGLSSPQNTTEAFITDESQLEIQTEVILPMEGRASNIVISDTVKEVKLPKAEFVEYLEFRAGSTNSIPFSIEIQGYFFDSNGVLIDVLILPSDNQQVVGPGQPLVVEGSNVIKETAPASYQSTIHITKERYKAISEATTFVIEGRIQTLGSTFSPPKSVKFYPWQTCTFKLSAYAILNVDITNPESDLNIDN